MQWKADWAMRWYALGVDYEMSGKDLIDSVKLSSKICRILGRQPPQTLTYELFLDQNAQKISKSKGNGLSIEEWLRYAPPESLSQYMFNQPTRAKRLFFDVIPRAMDEYLANAEKLLNQPEETRPSNPAWFIQRGKAGRDTHSPLSFATLLNLASVANVDAPAPLWKFIQRYDVTLSPETHPYVDRLVGYALAYYRDFVKPDKRFRQPSEQERQALQDLATELAKADRSFPRFKSRTSSLRWASVINSPRSEHGSAVSMRFSRTEGGATFRHFCGVTRAERDGRFDRGGACTAPIGINRRAGRLRPEIAVLMLDTTRLSR